MSAKSEEAAHSAMHMDPSSKRMALLIAVLAAFLAFSETLGKSAQTDSISYNVEASNLWAFFQAKTIRMTVVGTAAEEMEVATRGVTDPEQQAIIKKRVDGWRANAARYNDEPETNEGRKQLSARALAAEKKRDIAMARYHHYEVASALFQIGIVLASATVITGAMALAWGAIGLGGLALFFTAVGLFAPKAIHLF
jgi:hypothetical protein